MSNAPGYFKAAKSGKTFKFPRDYCYCLSDDHTAILKKKRSVIPLYEHRSSGLDNLNRRSREGDLIGCIVEGCDCDQWKKSRKRRSKPRKIRYSAAFSRYREHNPNFEKSGEIPPGTKLATFKFYRNGQEQWSEQLNTTGKVDGSIDAWRCWDQVNPGPPYRAIGPLALQKASIPGSSKYHVNKMKSPDLEPGSWYEFTGDFVDDGQWGSDSTSNYLFSSIPSVVGYDTLAWDKLKPKVSKAGAAQFFYELRDLPRMLKTSLDDLFSLLRRVGLDPATMTASRGSLYVSDLRSIANPQRASDSFLNHEFGWAPFIGDLAKLFNVWSESEKYISDLVKGNGQWTRKRATLDRSVEQKREQRYYFPAVMPQGWQLGMVCDTQDVDGIPCKGYTDIFSVVEQEVWAVGDFTYYRPEFDMSIEGAQGYFNDLQRLLTLYGARITPSLIYKVTPWTWLVDWFAGFGPFIERLDDFTVDGIVSKGLCIMRHMKRTVAKVCTLFFHSGTRVFTWRRTLETKVRKIADSPYGFDRPWNQLSSRQLAILGALAITRADSGFVSRGA
jgi:hypothetical protein